MKLIPEYEVTSRRTGEKFIYGGWPLVRDFLLFLPLWGMVLFIRNYIGFPEGHPFAKYTYLQYLINETRPEAPFVCGLVYGVVMLLVLGVWHLIKGT